MTKRIILFDNYDSFTHNLLHLLKMVRPAYKFEVIRNSDKDILQKKPEALIIGPGPMTPSDTGFLNQYFDKIIAPQSIPVLGVCLGMQYLAWRLQIPIVKSGKPAHGAAVKVQHKGTDLFTDISKAFSGARYNSLEICETAVQKHQQLKLLATETYREAAMAFRYNTIPWAGVQFHPESFLTQYGDRIIENFFTQYVEA